MKKFWMVLLLFSLQIFAQNIIPETDFPKIKSTVTMPVRIPLSEISAMVNTSVKDLIYTDDSYTDNNNDQFKIKVWKTRPIRLIGGTKQNLLVEVPLKIWASKGVGTLGLYSYQETTFETVMYFNTTIQFKNNWTVVTSTRPNGFKWVTKPVLDYGTIKIPITPIVEKSLKKEQEKFCSTMDAQMNAQLNFRNYALMAWNLFAQPFQVSEEYDTWLKVTPAKVNMAPLTFYRNAIDALIGIDVYSETFVGQQPAVSRTLTNVPDFSNVADLSDSFLLQTTANISYEEATEMAGKMFMGKEFNFNGGKSKIKVSDIKVYGKDGKVVIEIETEGTVKGTSYISGTPVYDASKREIVLRETHFRLRTSNVMQKTASLLFRGKITGMIEKEYGIPTAELEDYSKKSTEEAFNKEYYKGLKMSGKVQKMKPGKVLVGKQGLTVVIDTKAQLRLLIQGL